jgi:hypothetical protein
VRTEVVDKAAFEASMKSVPGGVRAVSGLGESAYFQPSTNQFFMYKGKTKVSLNVVAPGLDKLEAREQALLRKIAARI